LWWFWSESYPAENHCDECELTLLPGANDCFEKLSAKEIKL